jgi:threonine/homoserine/homoserine lactone efflux protein
MSVSSAVLSFALVAGLLTIIPGLDTALVLRSAIVHGPRHAFATALGIGAGALTWGAAAAAGVSVLLTTSTIAYTALRLVGAAYLVWIGVGLLWSVLRRWEERAGVSELGEASESASEAAGRSEAVAGPVAAPGLRRAWSRGLLTNLLNPKIGAFYLAVLPQFIPEHAPPLAMGILLALVHDLEGMLWFSLVILGATRMRDLLRRRTAQRVIDGSTGSVLIGFGVKLGLSR